MYVKINKKKNQNKKNNAQTIEKSEKKNNTQTIEKSRKKE